jgi:hypothetical protein
MKEINREDPLFQEADLKLKNIRNEAAEAEKDLSKDKKA